MALLITHWDIEKNIWELNAPMKYAFPNIPKNDESSKLAWAFALYYHPDSDYAELSVKDKLDFIRRYLDSEDWQPDLDEWTEKKDEYADWNRYLNNNFPRLALYREDRNLVTWGEKFDERTQFMQETPYGLDTFDMLEKLMGNTSKIRDQYLKALAERKSKKEEQTFGAITESASDEKLI